MPDLVATRRVHLANGIAYVHQHDMGSIILSHFKELLTRALGVTARNWINHLAAEEEGRLAPIVDGLSQRWAHCRTDVYVPKLAHISLIGLL